MGEWKYIKGDFKIEEEKEYGDSAVSSHEWCQRYFDIPLSSELNVNFASLDQLEFEVLIKGTPPKCEDLFVAYVQIYDAQGKELADHNSTNSKAQKKATEDWVLHKIIIKKSDLSSTNAAYIRVFEMGKDVEYWAGHYGTRFADEKVVLKFVESQPTTGNTNHIKHILGTRQLPNTLPLSTNFNKSMGNKIFIEGKLVKEDIKYNNLNDCDFNLSYNNYIVPINFKSETKSKMAHSLTVLDPKLETMSL